MQHPLKQLIADLETSDDVYGPREDSFLLARAADGYNGDRLLEVGTGTGVVAAVTGSGFESVTAVDIDPAAVEIARKNLPDADVKQSDLFENVDGEFDLVLFNPPYLPSEKPLQQERAWNGGENGREVVTRFIQGLPDHLAPGGAALILVSSLTGLDEVRDLLDDQGLTSDRVDSEKLFFEELVVLEAKRKEEE